MRLCSSLPANRSVCARRARGEEVCRSRWTEHPPGGDFHLATSGDFEMAIDSTDPPLRPALDDGPAGLRRSAARILNVRGHRGEPAGRLAVIGGRTSWSTVGGSKVVVKRAGCASL